MDPQDYQALYNSYRDEGKTPDEARRQVEYAKLRDGGMSADDALAQMRPTGGRGSGAGPGPSVRQGPGEFDVTPGAFASEFALDTGLGAVGGVLGWGADMGARLTDLADFVNPFGNPLQGAGDAIREGRDAMSQQFADWAGAETFAGSGQRFDEGHPGGGYVASTLLTNLGLEGASYIAGGGLARAGAAAVGSGLAGAGRLGGAVGGALSRLGARSGSGLRGNIAEASKDALAVLPLDLATSIRPENSTAGMIPVMADAMGVTPNTFTQFAEDVAGIEGIAGVAARTGFESTLGSTLDAALRTVGVGARGTRRKLEAAQGRRQIRAETADAARMQQPAEPRTPQEELELQNLKDEAAQAREANQEVEEPVVAEDDLAAEVREVHEMRGTDNPSDLEQAFDEIIEEDALEAQEIQDIIDAELERLDALEIEGEPKAAVSDAEEKAKARAHILADIDAQVASMEDGLQKERLMSTRRAIADGDDPRSYAIRLEAYGIDSRMIADAGVVKAPEIPNITGATSRLAGGAAFTGAFGETPEEHARNAIYGAVALTGGPVLGRVLARAAGRMGRTGHLVNVAASALPKTTVKVGAMTLEPKVARIIRDSSANKMSGKNWEELLFQTNKTTGEQSPRGFRQAEASWYGLQDFLRSRTGKVTKNEILTHIAGNQPEINVYTLVGDDVPEMDVVEIRGPGQVPPFKDSGSSFDAYLGKLNSTARWRDFTGDPKGDGSTGSNYREVVLSLKDNPMSSATFRHSEHTQDIDNPLVWIRLTERMDSAGQWNLYIEEIQSDFDQVGKKIKADQRELGLTEAQLSLGGETDLPDLRTVRSRDPTVTSATPQGKRLSDPWQYSFEPSDDLASGLSDYRAPEFPWENRTTELAVRYVIAEAKRRGIKNVTWTPADLQLERNNAGLYAESLSWHPPKEGESRGRLTGIKRETGESFQVHMTPFQLRRQFGRELAGRLQETTNAPRPFDSDSFADLIEDRLTNQNVMQVSDLGGSTGLVQLIDPRQFMVSRNRTRLFELYADDPFMAFAGPDELDARVQGFFETQMQALSNKLRTLQSTFGPNAVHAAVDDWLSDAVGSAEEFFTRAKISEDKSYWDEEYFRTRAGRIAQEAKKLATESRRYPDEIYVVNALSLEKDQLVSPMPGLARHYETLGRQFQNVLDKELGLKGNYGFENDVEIQDLDGYKHQRLTLSEASAGKNSYELFSHGAIGGGLLGAGAGAVAPLEDEEWRGTAILGGAIAGASGGKWLTDTFGPGGRAVSDADLAILRENPAAARTAARTAGAHRSLELLTARERVFGGDLGIRERITEARNVVEERVSNTVQERIVPFARKVRTGVTRESAPIEALGQDVANTLAQGRGHSSAAELMLEKDLAQIIESSKEHMLSIQALAKAERGIELALIGKETDELQLEDWYDTRRALSQIPEVAAGALAIQGYYRRLLDLKRSAGVLSGASYDRIVAKGDKYIPFLPEELVDEVTKGGTTYRPNNQPGVRKMTKHLNDAVIADPFVQAIRDTYETFRRIARHNTGVAVHDVMEAAPPGSLDHLMTKITGTPEKKDDVLDILIGDKRHYYRIHDPLLANAWSSYNKDLADDLFLPMLNKMRRFMQAGVTLTPVFQIRNGIRDFFMSAAQYPLQSGRALASATGGGLVGGAVAEPEDRLKGAAIGAGLAAGVPHTAAHVARTADALINILGPDAAGMVFGGLMGYVGSEDDDSVTDRMLKVAAGSAIGYGAGAGIGGTTLLGLDTGGLAGLLKEDNVFRQFVQRDRSLMDSYLENGGGQFGIFTQMNRDADKMYDRLLSLGVDASDVFHPQSLDHMFAMLHHPLQTAYDALTGVGGAIEMAPRLARYKHELRNNADIGTAIFQARDQGLDFATRGSNGAVRLMTAATPFLNPTLIGIDKLVRMAADPQTYPVVFAMLAAPTAALWMLNHSDPELRDQWTDRQQWERDNYWLVPRKWLDWTDADARGFVRVAKPFELGFLGATSIERALDALYDVDPAMAVLRASEATEGITQQALLAIASDFFASGMSPAQTFLGVAGIGPVVQAKMGGEHGYDAFTRRPINPYPWRDVEARDQQSPYTTTVAKWAHRSPALGSMLASMGFDSPAKIDFAIRAYGGTLAGQAAELITDAARAVGVDDSAPPPERGGIFSRAFITREGSVTNRETLLRQRFSESEQVWNSFQQLMQQGDATELQRRMGEPEFQAQVQRHMILRPYMNMVDDLTRMRRMIRDNGVLDQTEKDQMITELNQTISGIATSAGSALARINDTL